MQLVPTWMRQVLQLRIWPVREQHWQISYLLQVQRRSGTVTWLRFGAPAGLASLPLARGVFPAVDHAPAIDPCDLCVDEDVFTYAGIDQDEVAQVEVTDLHRRGLFGSLRFNR